MSADTAPGSGGLAQVDLYSERPSAEAVRAVPADAAREYRAVGFRLEGSRLVVAFAEPPDGGDVRSLESLLDLDVAPVVADPLAVDRVIEIAYPEGGADQPAVSPSHATAPPGAPGPDGTLPLHIDDLLRLIVELGASDLHLTAGIPPAARVHGSIRSLEGCPALDGETIREMVFGILTQSLRERFEADRELDTAHSLPGVGRYRVNVFVQRGVVGAVFRAIPHDVPPFESLGIPEVVRTFAELQRGLVLLTGPTGSGKSTTLASLIDIINAGRPLHIVTVEDPIEFLHHHKRAIINQREVGVDTHSFAEALKHVLRQDPDVILVGEMRDLETIATALTAAETGHLVFATLHTQDAPQTVDRVIDVFPTSQQAQIRVQLSTSLEGIVTQQLVPTAGAAGRAVATEVLVATPAIRNLVREAKTYQIPSLMQTGGKFGMQTMDQSLATLVKAGTITEGSAVSRCHSEDDLRRYLTSQ